MGLMDKLKTQLDLWKLDKYTKRRNVAMPEFEPKDRDFYRHYYQDGVYLHQHQKPAAGVEKVHRKSTIMKRKSAPMIRCSETYNYS
ncbi:predicted protein [Lichtheimia corymbifera JMRC:FSU:9682]|uniref:Uncharacterized protein n=2 Tax=Lichtheimia TaxID=688353 RepID=A0A068RT86_9FUNG|nr:uncharacterized protein O0I10_012800 [Lichtheimia ornata]KAJ8651637.1 hypothetical protein O0I10_012800 [Lichtheimia ornata]CDH53388.1 predicted protein [Lichtheimia corymbifera JMRC:FSU:9682]